MRIFLMTMILSFSATAQTPPVEVGAMCDKQGNILIAVAAHEAGLYKFTLPVNFCGVGV
jgi:hypothetical protein